MTAPRRGPTRRVSGPPPGLAAVLSLLGLAAVFVASMALLTGSLPISTGPTSATGSPEPGGGGPIRTPTPSNVVVVPPDPRSTVPGTIAYVKAGTIWVQSGTEAQPLLQGEADEMPAWSYDGKWMYFIRTITQPGRFPSQGSPQMYNLTYPNLIRYPIGGGKEEKLDSGLYKKGSYTWFYWLRQPAPAPDGKTVMVVSDAPDPLKSDVVLQSLNVANGKLTRIPAAEQSPLGHQDPTWRSDGALALYVKNQREGLKGTPQIMRLNLETKKSAAFSAPGYSAPSYSPDGGFVAATKTSAFGTDIVILDGRTGAEVAKVTDDGSSFKPAWSPRGDAIAFLRISGGVTDLVMATLDRSGPIPALKDEVPLTDAAGLDPESRPTWYIPPDQLPQPSPAATATAPASAGASPSPTASP